MLVKDAMTPGVEILNPTNTVRDAAKKMKECEVGVIPVCDGERIQGILTDRDIVLRCVAEGHDVNTCTVEHITTAPIEYVYEDESLDAAAHVMEVKHVRRLIVLNRNKELTGILSLGDIAIANEDTDLPGRTIKTVSEPTGPHLQ